MTELTYYCWACYGRNPVPAGTCLHCGGEIEAPPGTGYAERLLWALDHPVSERGVEAALILGRRRERSAARRLRALALESSDPFLAAAALESLVAICGVEPNRDLLEPLANSTRSHLRAVARRLLGREGPA